MLLAAASPVFPATVQPSPPVPIGFLAADGADFGMLRVAGGDAVKLVADWADIESRRGTLRWDLLDAAVDAARAAGLRVVLVLSYTPRWASPATGAELADPAIYARQPPKRLEDWDAFVTAAASRYRDRVHDWQIWTARGLPLFRGTTREYVELLRSARVIIKAVDPASRIILSTPLGIDLTDLRRLLADAAGDFDIISLAPRGISPDGLLRPLGVLRERLLSAVSKPLWIEWDPHSYGQRSTWPGQLVKLEAIARAFGVERLFWTADATAITQVVLGALAAQVGRRPYTGYVIQQRALLLVFGDPDAAAVAWSTGEARVTVEGGEVLAYAPTGDARSITADGDRWSVPVGTDPVVLAGIGSALIAEARQTAQSGGPLLPAATDFSQSGAVTARLGRVNVEHGLYNLLYRAWRNEATDVVEVDGAEAVRSDNARERVYLRFDVDDTFLFFVDGRATVEVAVEVHGVSAPQQVGFNLFYDSMSGYRPTPWQWVDVSPGWVTYTFRLTDAAFANTWGWDFWINAAGNRGADLIVRSVTVRKIVP